MQPASPVLAILLASVGAVACSDDVAPQPDAAPPTGPARVTVERYHYEIDLESQASAATLDLRIMEGGDCITLPSRNPNISPGAVILDGAPAEVTMTATRLTACGPGWPAGAAVKLHVTMMQDVSTLGASDVGYSVFNDANGQPVHYLVSWVEGCDRFAPCDTTPGTFSRYTFTVRHAAGVRALCPGRITTVIPTVTTCEFDHAGGPTYSTFGIIANASWQETSLGTWEGVRATLYARPTSAVPARIDPAFHQGFLAWMSARFGVYPYGDELRIVVAPTYWSGFEHPGNIVLDEGLTRPVGQVYLNPVAHVLAHEIVHQWAGDQTTLADTYDFVWKEAMAEYLTFLYESEVDPPAAAVTVAYWKNAARNAGYHPVPEDRPTLFDYYGHVYGAGPMVLFRQLEVMTSRAQVVQAIERLLGEERAISVADVQAALEATTLLDLDTYFDTWVRGSGVPTWPTFTVQITREPPVQHVMLSGGDGYPCDFNVEVRGANPDERAKVRFVRGIDPDGFMNIDTDVPFVIAQTVIDPDSECLAYPGTAMGPPVEPHPPGWSPWGRVD